MLLATHSSAAVEERLHDHFQGSGEADIDKQTRAVFESLARDMPLRMAAAEPEYKPNLSSAAIRLRRFVSFYPAFANAALFNLTGRMLATTELRECRVHVTERSMFDGQLRAGYCGVSYDEGLARIVGGEGSDALIYAGVACPYDRATCGVVVARLC